MDVDAIFAAVAANRRAVADLLETLTPEQLATQSLCGEWDVATVGAHLAYAANPKLPAFLLELVRNGGSFDRANSAAAVRQARDGVPATIAKIRANAGSRFAPPLVGPRAPLGDVIIHTADISRPLGLPHNPAADQVRTVLEFLTAGRSSAFVRGGTRDGLRLVAEDIDMNIGEGEEVRGSGIDVAMALMGRTVALNGLTGPGVDILGSRLG